MDEKHRLPSLRNPYRRSSRTWIALVFLGFCGISLWRVGACAPASLMAATMPQREQSTLHASNKLVPLEAHIMSKCGDSKDCLRDMILPVMMRSGDKINFTLSFIGTPTTNDGVSCKHGPEECMGNILELCAANLYPEPKIWLGFTMCLTRDYDSIPARSLVEDCALEHAIDFKELNDCATRDDGGFGIGMLRDSVQRTSAAGVIKSCTVRLNEEIYCVRDESEWKDCPNGPGVNDLIIAIEKLWQSS